MSEWGREGDRSGEKRGGGVGRKGRGSESGERKSMNQEWEGKEKKEKMGRKRDKRRGGRVDNTLTEECPCAKLCRRGDRRQKKKKRRIS